MTFVALAACLMPVGPATGAECEKVIELSKVVRDTVKTQDDFEENAQAFCSEYAKSESARNSRSYDASYKFLSASIGRENASRSDIAAKFCSAKSGAASKQSAYREYVESIAGDAYDAYRKCKELEGAGLSFDIDTAGIRRTDLGISVAFSPGRYLPANSQARLSVTASPGFTCKWDGRPDSSVTMDANSAVALQCTRASAQTEGYVKIVANNIGGARPLTLNWQTYGEDGLPSDLARANAARLEQANAKLEALNQSLHGAVVAFDALQCPSGWDEYLPAQGRFIRGIDNSGSGADPDGKRAPGTLQGDDNKLHSHGYMDIYWAEAWGSVGARLIGNKGDQDQDNKGYEMARTTAESGGKEARPKNVALLYCVHR